MAQGAKPDDAPTDTSALTNVAREAAADVPDLPAEEPAEPTQATLAAADHLEEIAQPSPLSATATPQSPLWEDLIPREPAEDNDDLLSEAIEMVRKLEKASTSLLQRRFRIGYTRAARLMDTMEEKGVIGPPTGTSKAREVLPWNQDDDKSQDTGGQDTDSE